MLDLGQTAVVEAHPLLKEGVVVYPFQEVGEAE